MSADRRRLLFLPAAVLAATMVLGACTGDGEDDDVDPDPGPRKAGQPEFAVVSDVDGNVAVASADGTLTPVPDVAVDFESEFSGLDATRAAFVGNGRIGIVDGEGRADAEDCPGCAGVAVTDQGIVTAQQDYQPGFGFQLVVFDDELRERTRAPARRVVERPADSDFLAENGLPPVLLGATDETAYVGYLSRNGGGRAGPSVVAAYALDGELGGTLLADGLFYEHQLSPDGDHLAVMVGGSGGACVLGNRLEVAETATMTWLGTDPELPGGVVAPANPAVASWWQGSGLAWAGDEVLVTGGVHVPEQDGCDDSPDLYQRRYDPDRQRMTDDGPLDRAQVGWFGEDCAAGVYLQGLQPEPLISVQDADGTVTELDRRWTTVRYAAGPPAECAG